MHFNQERVSLETEVWEEISTLAQSSKASGWKTEKGSPCNPIA